MSYFSTKFKELREENKLMQIELADAFKVSQNTIHKWENGKSEPNTETLCDIATYFEVSIDYLLGGEPNFEKVIVENYLTRINNSLTRIGKAKLESYAEGLLASEDSSRLMEIKNTQNK